MRFNLLDFLLPRETKFYGLFKEQAGCLVKAAAALRDFASDLKGMEDDEARKRVAAIKEVENEADAVTERINAAIEDTFITPFDREDIHAIAINLDQVIDLINALASRVDIYGIRKLPKNAVNFTELLVEGADGLLRMFDDMERKKDVSAAYKKVHEVEQKADYLFSLSVGDLFQKEKDPLDVIKFKDVYEELEEIADSIDAVAKMIRRVMIKQG